MRDSAGTRRGRSALRLSGDIVRKAKCRRTGRAEIQMQLGAEEFSSGSGQWESRHRHEDAIRRFSDPKCRADGFCRTQIKSGKIPARRLRKPQCGETTPKAPDPPRRLPERMRRPSCVRRYRRSPATMITIMLVSGGKHLGGG